MEIYSSSAEQARTTTDTPIYLSRTRLLVGAVIWLLMFGFFSLLAWRVHTEVGKLVFALVLVAFTIWQVLRCVKGVFNPDTPALIFTQAGLQPANGKLIPWSSIVENNYTTNTYFGFPVSKTIKLKVGQPAKPLLIPASAMQLNGDKYFALCDRYQAAAN